MAQHIGFAASAPEYVAHSHPQETTQRQRTPPNPTSGMTQHFSKPRLSVTSSGLPLRDYQPPADSFRAPPKNQSPPNVRSTPGVLAQDFRFPQAPAPIAALRPSRSREFQTPRSKARISHAASSQYSPITEVTTPSTTRSPTSAARPADSPSSAYPDTIVEEADWETPHYNSEPQFPAYGAHQEQGLVRQASWGRKAKPSLTTIRSSGNDQQGQTAASNPVTPITPASRVATMDALSAAIAAGFTTSHKDTYEVTALPDMPSHPRMPFDSTPPRSGPLGAASSRNRANTSTTSSAQTPGSAVSARSGNPLLGLGIDDPSVSDAKSKRRPPRLDMDAVRDAEARGSTTSLADLIRRATRLASNLDRGKTASKLNMLDAFNSHEKLNKLGRRESSMSDMLSAFPPPAARSKSDVTGWTEKGTAYTSTEVSPTEKAPKARRCCGMSLTICLILLVVLALLVAAAVLIPVFLILVPRQHSNIVDLAHCKTTHLCANGGSSVVVNNQCSCVCVKGYTGSLCGQLDPTCVTASVKGPSESYNNATMGTSMMPLLSGTANTFDIPLNSTSLLGMFASGNLTCESENSLVTFSAQPKKRSLILPRVADGALPLVVPRQNYKADPVTGTQDGIVFATSSAPPSLATYVASAVATASTSASSTVAAAAPTSTQSSNVTTQQIDFAEVVVLYVLEKSMVLSIAVNANQLLDEYLGGTQQNDTVEVGYGDFPVTANFRTFEIETAGGAVGGLGR